MADDMSSELSDIFEEFDDEENDKFLAQYFTKTPEDEEKNILFRPTLSDEQKIGFYSLDRTTQTEQTEIIDLKDMTNVIQQLLKDAAEMKRDINFTRHAMEADFEAKLQNKSIDMYCRVNERIDEIEKMHQEKVGTVRRAFKQQLADAISRMHTYYNQSMEQRMSSEEEQQKASAERWEVRLKKLQATIQKQEMIISMLEGQLAEQQEALILHMAEEETVHEPTPEPEPDKPPSRSESVLMELDSFRDQVEDLQKFIKRKEREIRNWEEVNEDLKKEIQSLQLELEQERKNAENLKVEREKLKASAEKDLATTQKQIEKQKQKMEKDAEERIRKAKEETLANAMKTSEAIQNKEQERIKQLLEEKKQLELTLIQEREKAKEKPKEAAELEKAKRNQAQLLYEVNKLKKEIEKVHQTWEKKFAILQQSLHALKDESYLRQTLQKQAATLHMASISYAYESPMGIAPSKPTSQAPPFKKPLPADIHLQPDIGKGMAKSPAHDYISYTVSAASGRATAMLPPDENQIMSDDDTELPADIIPLQSPVKSRSKQDCSDAAEEDVNSRPSARSHVVVVPSVEAL